MPSPRLFRSGYHAVATVFEATRHFLWQAMVGPFQRHAEEVVASLKKSEDWVAEAISNDERLLSLRPSYYFLRTYARDEHPLALLTRAREGRLSDSEREDGRLNRAIARLTQPSPEVALWEGYIDAADSLAYYRSLFHRLMYHPRQPLPLEEAVSLYALTEPRAALQAYPLPQESHGVLKTQIDQMRAFAKMYKMQVNAHYTVAKRLEAHRTLRQEALEISHAVIDAQQELTDFEETPATKAVAAALTEIAGIFKELAQYGLTRSHGWVEDKKTVKGLTKAQLVRLRDLGDESPYSENPLLALKAEPDFAAIANRISDFAHRGEFKDLILDALRGKHPVLADQSAQFIALKPSMAVTAPSR